MSNTYVILDFDTNLFGFKVAKILEQNLSPIGLQKILIELSSLDVTLVYWQIESSNILSNTSAKQHNGFLGSQQVLYSIDLSQLKVEDLMTDNIKQYTELNVTNELEELALHAGNYSHFKADPRFPNNLFNKLYFAWIENSLNGKMADVVLIAQHDDHLTGFITAGKKDGRGDIGLLAVNENFRGNRLGTKLVHSAQKYWLERGLKKAQVITQKINQPACNLYEKCGFTVEKLNNFYHFWL